MSLHRSLNLPSLLPQTKEWFYLHEHPHTGNQSVRSERCVLSRDGGAWELPAHIDFLPNQIPGTDWYETEEAACAALTRRQHGWEDEDEQGV